MKLKFSIFIFFIFISKLFATEVIVAKVNLPFKSMLSPKNLEIKDIKELPFNCIPIKIDDLKKAKFRTLRFIKKEKVICKNDIKQVVKKSIIFNFGSIQIETTGKILYENKEYIKIKKPNGKIEKIYKDGRVR